LILEVNRASISSQGIVHLRNAASLRLIEIRYVPLADDAVPELMKLTAATHMKLYGTQITPEGADRIQRALPTTIVDVRAGAFLGIGGDVHSLGVIVLDVRDRTSAQAAGLLQGDVIVTYEGQRVEDFTGLTALIAKNLPKDVVTIQYVRNPELRAATRVRHEGDVLGIEGEAHVVGCKITKVAEDSLASQLGLRPGEVVFRLNDTAVQSPEHLAQLFAAIRVGEPLLVEFAPRLEVRTARVELGEWD
jgi:S1-C subfamily serine protease